MPQDLIDYWKRCDFGSPPFLHPEDKPFLYQRNGTYIDDRNYDLGRFLASSRFGDFGDNRLHLSLYPSPYGGNLATADIVVLLLNPGFNLTDYYGETEVAGFRSRLLATLHQSLDDAEFPFMWLDPGLCWHGGFQWWEKKLRPILRRIAGHKGISYLEAMRDLSRRLAHVELVPYHSQNFAAGGLIRKLPSVRTVKQFVKNNLEVAAANGSKTVIATRRIRDWDLASQTKIIIYSGGQTRGASLGPETPGGMAILEKYGIPLNELAHPGDRVTKTKLRYQA